MSRVTTVGTAVAPPVNVTSVAPVSVRPGHRDERPHHRRRRREARRARRLHHRQRRRAGGRSVGRRDLILPVTAPSGTGNVSCVALTLDRARRHPERPDLHPGRRHPDLQVEPAHRDHRRAAAHALSGVTSVIFGSTLKLAALGAVPIGFVTLTGPVSAPSGTTTFSDVADHHRRHRRSAARERHQRGVGHVRPGHRDDASPPPPSPARSSSACGGCTTVSVAALVAEPSAVVT